MARSSTSADPPALSVIVPAYNEASAVRTGVLQQILDYLGSSGEPFELLVVDDGSEDGTAELTRAVIAGHAAVRLVQTDHGGKAHALAHGMQAAQGRIVLFSDMDQ